MIEPIAMLKFSMHRITNLKAISNLNMESLL